MVLSKFVSAYSPFKNFLILKENNVISFTGTTAPEKFRDVEVEHLQKKMKELRKENVPGKWYYNMQKAHDAVAVRIQPGGF